MLVFFALQTSYEIYKPYETEPPLESIKDEVKSLKSFQIFDKEEAGKEIGWHRIALLLCKEMNMTVYQILELPALEVS